MLQTATKRFLLIWGLSKILYAPDLHGGFMKKISLIAVYNKPQLLNEMVESANRQKNVEVELITLDNTGHRFSSASKALNYGTTKATGDVIVYLHQDIEFMSDDVLELGSYSLYHILLLFASNQK